MPRIVEIKAFKFEELSYKAKERARAWYRDGVVESNDFAESVTEDAVTIAAFLGITIATRPVKLMGGSTRQDPCIYWSGFWSQGDGACFDGRWSAAEVNLPGLVEHAPKDETLHKIGAAFAAIAVQFPEASFTVKQRGHYSHSGCTEFEFDFPRGGDAEVFAWDSPEGKARDQLEANASRELIQAAREFMDWIYRQLESEYEYRTSDEQVDDSITANDYEFTDAGNRFPF